uniref:Uncharacterized protein n=1 Tax=Rhizophora mucronata TaxID=61149 RepID=A0A2P2N3F4_RHIMU
MGKVCCSYVQNCRWYSSGMWVKRVATEFHIHLKSLGTHVASFNKELSLK